MLLFLLVLFVIACIVLIFSVLMQSGHGNLGDIFGGGGSEHAIFGGTGGKGFIVKVTIGAAAVFLATSLILSVMYSRQGRVTSAPQAPVEPVASPQGAPAGNANQSLPQGQ